MLSLTDIDELRQTVSLVHKILDTKQRALQELYGEDEVDSNCLLQVCSRCISAYHTVLKHSDVTAHCSSQIISCNLEFSKYVAYNSAACTKQPSCFRTHSCKLAAAPAVCMGFIK